MRFFGKCASGVVVVRRLGRDNRERAAAPPAPASGGAGHPSCGGAARGERGAAAGQTRTFFDSPVRTSGTESREHDS